jgi:methionine-rich copper-binding protein CopC
MTSRPGVLRIATRLIVLLGAAGAGLLLVVVAPAAAHTDLVTSTPAAGATLAAAPTAVRLVFEEPVSARLASVVVTGPDGVDHAQGAPTVAGTVVVQHLSPLTVVGRFRVAYRVVSDDGHPLKGSFSFTVTAPASPAAAVVPVVPAPSLLAAAAPRVADAVPGADRGLAGWVVPAAGAALLLVAGAGVVAHRQRGSELDPGGSARRG